MTALKTVLLTLLVLVLTLSAAVAKEQPNLDTMQKKISYAVGRNIGDSLKIANNRKHSSNF